MSVRSAVVRWWPILPAAALVLWVRLLPLSLGRIDDSVERHLRETTPAADRAALEPEATALSERLKAELRYRGADGREHVYLGDYDSYLWVRHARNYLRTGTPCDAVVDGECRDTYANAPVGARMRYGRSVHIAAIAGLHRLIIRVAPDYPLTATAFWVPVVVGLLGLLPAFAIGQRLAGPVGGLAAGVVTAVNPVLLGRSIGSDDDVWNVVLPLFMAWGAIEATGAASRRRQILCAGLAAAAAGLHAASWRGWVFACGVVLIGLVANAALLGLRCAADGWRWRSPRGQALAGALLVLVTFTGTTGLVATLLGTAGKSHLAVPATVVAPVLAGPASRQHPVPVPAADWPQALDTVAELGAPRLPQIAGASGGPGHLLVAGIGLLLLTLPRRRWRWWHVSVLIVATAFYGCLLHLFDWSGWSRVSVVGLFALPLVVAGAASLGTEPGADQPDRGAVLIVMTWFLAALYQAHAGQRFTLLLAAPLGIAGGVTLGRLHLWASGLVAGRTGRLAVVTRPLLFALAAAALGIPLRRGAAEARAFVPAMRDTWWDALTKIREATPPDAIVNTWWDYGHWVKYVAERRVSTDGASLRTHAPYWIGRALLAPSERETVGLLRMLNCGSDAAPEPEGWQGAYGKLVGLGMDGVAARSLIVALAALDRDAARAHLGVHGIGGQAAEDVLRSTHCPPPPAYLLLTSNLIYVRGWRHLGNWNFARAYAARAARHRPEAETVAALVRRFGLPEADARALYARVRTLTDEREVREFIAPDASYFARDWFPCRVESDGGAWICPIELSVGERGPVLDAFQYVVAAPERSRFLCRTWEGDTLSRRGFKGMPAGLVMAGRAPTHEVSFDRPMHPDLGVLVDAPRRRILVGPPYLLRSTFTQLMYLDGRYAEHFEKFDERRGSDGERLVTWRIADDRQPLAAGGTQR
jgi:hypothetical protein